jgi:hypothetical protein
MAEKICADSSQKLNIVFGALAVITDAMLMAIPLWTLPKLHISFSEKITLLASFFALGRLQWLLRWSAL